MNAEDRIEITFSINKIFTSHPLPSSTPRRHIPSEESASHLQLECWDGRGNRSTKSSILATTTAFFIDFLPNHTPTLGDSQQDTKPMNGRGKLTNTQLSSDSRPWHRTQLVKVTESLPASHPEAELPGSLIRQPVLPSPLRRVFRPSQSCEVLCAAAPSM